MATTKNVDSCVVSVLLTYEWLVPLCCLRYLVVCVLFSVLSIMIIDIFVI